MPWCRIPSMATRSTFEEMQGVFQGTNSVLTEAHFPRVGGRVLGCSSTCQEMPSTTQEDGRIDSGSGSDWFAVNWSGSVSGLPLLQPGRYVIANSKRPRQIAHPTWREFSNFDVNIKCGIYQGDALSPLLF